jgi:hypothetical protein
MDDNNHRRKRRAGDDTAEVASDLDSESSERQADEHLVAYYKSLLDSLEKERHDWLRQLEACKLAPSEEVRGRTVNEMFATSH